MIDEYQYEVQVSGIPENNEASRIKRQFKDKEEVENVCSSIGCTYPIKECRRIGKFVDGRTRKLLVTFNSVWDARALVAKASEKELYKNSRSNHTWPVRGRREKKTSSIEKTMGVNALWNKERRPSDTQVQALPIDVFGRDRGEA